MMNGLLRSCLLALVLYISLAYAQLDLDARVLTDYRAGSTSMEDLQPVLKDGYETCYGVTYPYPIVGETHRGFSAGIFSLLPPAVIATPNYKSKKDFGRVGSTYQFTKRYRTEAISEYASQNFLTGFVYCNKQLSNSSEESNYEGAYIDWLVVERSLFSRDQVAFVVGESATGNDCKAHVFAEPFPSVPIFLFSGNVDVGGNDLHGDTSFWVENVTRDGFTLCYRENHVPESSDHVVEKGISYLAFDSNTSLEAQVQAVKDAHQLYYGTSTVTIEDEDVKYACVSVPYEESGFTHSPVTIASVTLESTTPSLGNNVHSGWVEESTENGFTYCFTSLSESGILPQGSKFTINYMSFVDNAFDTPHHLRTRRSVTATIYTRSGSFGIKKYQDRYVEAWRTLYTVLAGHPEDDTTRVTAQAVYYGNRGREIPRMRMTTVLSINSLPGDDDDAPKSAWRSILDSLNATPGLIQHEGGVGLSQITEELHGPVAFAKMNEIINMSCRFAKGRDGFMEDYPNFEDFDDTIMEIPCEQRNIDQVKPHNFNPDTVEEPGEFKWDNPLQVISFHRPCVYTSAGLSACSISDCSRDYGTMRETLMEDEAYEGLISDCFPVFKQHVCKAAPCSIEADSVTFSNVPTRRVSGGLTTTAIALIVVIPVVVLAIGIGAAFYFYRGKRRATSATTGMLK